jgi:hypothetical protein
MNSEFDFAAMQVKAVTVVENCYNCDSGDGGGDGAGDGSGGGCDNS